MARSRSRAQRKVAFIKAHMRDAEDWLAVTIGNVSASGLMVKCQRPPVVGSAVELRRRGMVIKGHVVWVLETRFGLQSCEPIDVQALTAGSGLDVNQTRSEEPARRGLWHWREDA